MEGLSMCGAVTVSRTARTVLSAIMLLLVIYLAVLALSPEVADGFPVWLRWFGRPGSWPTIAIVVGLLTLVCAWSFRAHGGGAARGVPVAVIAGLSATSVVLGFSSYWACHDEKYPAFFTPLTWTANLVKGGVGEQTKGGQVCPALTPVALDVARLSALGAIFLSVAGIAVALFRSQTDRIQASLAKSVTAVVGIDDDAQSMLGAVARTLDRRSRLVLITTSPDRPCVHESRIQGARVVAIDDNGPNTLESLRLWRHLDRLYLLSPDPSTNLARLRVISRRLSAVGRKQRLPLIVRIDDPWQAEAWRAQQFGGSDTRWAADAVGKYEVTARRLLDEIIAAKTVQQIIVCGTSHLTLALCADMAQRRLERDYYTAPHESALPSLTLVAENSEEYLHDHEFQQQELLGLASSGPQIQAIPEAPSVPMLMRLITGDGDAGASAVIFVDADPAAGVVIDATVGTRLAARFPAVLIYAWDPNARVTEDRLPIVGELRTYRLAMDVPEGQAHDAWERAAMLIHDRYAAEVGHHSDATLPWAQLGEFYRESNRRQVRNALWMVEQIAGHTWNTWGSAAAAVSLSGLRGVEPLDQLALIGFDRDAALGMARAEHEDWRRYYRAAGWRYGPARDDERKIHDGLVDWATVEANPGLLEAAMGSLAATLSQLRELGYRSRPVWEQFRRAGTVIAEQRPTAWAWTSHSGQIMRANAGDWAVQDCDGDSWSVRDAVFRATYEHTAGNRWRRVGLVLARAARHGETIDTPEGPTTAVNGDWVVRGNQGEQWPVPAEQFSRRYRRAVSPSNFDSDQER
jgi:hypothetical protein